MVEENFLQKTGWSMLWNWSGWLNKGRIWKLRSECEDFHEFKKFILLNIRNNVQMDEIPPEMVINLDQTGINYVPVSSWMIQKAGSKWFEIVGNMINDRSHQFLGCNMSGEFLPPQLVYQGNTKQRFPHFQFWHDWEIIFSQNHWANEDITKQYVCASINSQADMKLVAIVTTH